MHNIYSIYFTGKVCRMSNNQPRDTYTEVMQQNPWSKYPWRKSYGVWTLGGLIVLFFLFATSRPELVPYLALHKDTAGFRFWQPFTACFLDFSLLNVIFNLLMLVMLGIPLEHEWKRLNLIISFVAPAITSLLVYMLIMPPGMLALGSSGGMCGLMGAALFHLGWQEWNLFGVMKIRLKTLLIVLVIASVFICFLNGNARYAVVPIVGFFTGLFYCRFEKFRQKQEAEQSVQKTKEHKHEKHGSHLEID